MNLRKKIWILSTVIVGIIAAADAFLGIRDIDHSVEEELTRDAEYIRGLLMATRRVYHKQFLSSGLPVDDRTVGFLPAHAMSRISEDFPNWSRSGMSFNNVSDHPRNSKSKADVFELAAMDYFRANPKVKDRLAKISQDGRNFYHYTAPIWIEEYCLGCHGERDKAPPTIRANYPEAYGYKVGDLRGVMSIKLPTKSLWDREFGIWSNRFYWRLAGYCVLLIALTYFLNYFITSRLAQLRGTATALGRGDYDSRSTDKIPDEIGELASTLNLMGEEIKNRSNALAKSEEQLKFVADHAPVSIGHCDLGRRYKFVNQQYAEMFGLQPADIIGKHPREIMGEAAYAHASPHMDKVLAGKEVEYELELPSESSGPRFMQVRYMPQRDAADRVVGFIAAITNITARKQTEAKLRESQDRLTAVFQASPIGIVVSQIADGKIIDVNDAALQLYGYARDEVIGRTVAELGTYANPKQREELVEMLGKHGSVDRFQIDFRRKNGEVGVMQASARVIDLQAKPCLLALMLDITAQLKAEKEKALLESQFQQAQKMDSVGRLAGGVAHDFNNMLTVILGNVQMAIEQTDSTQPLHADLVEIQNAANRSADLTRQLLAFARKQVVEPKVLDLNAAVEGIIRMLQRLIGEDISLKWLPAKNLWLVRIDPSQIDQILANLCINARDAIDGVGNIVIETGNRTLDEVYCAAHPECLPGEYVRLAVSDDGHGIEKETLDHVFEPFFTTKGAGEGTGLGLATVYGAVKQNNGHVNVYSEPGTGTTFTIYLPRHKGGVEQADAADSAARKVRGRETILLVEDEPSILKLTTRILERQGYTVLAATTPNEAIRLASENADSIHLLMTDVVMPEMNGRELAKHLQTSYPNLKLLFMSGYTANIIVHQGVLDQGVQFIQKPFSVEDLASKVREVLDSASGLL